MPARLLTARFELVTPAFASGARPEDSAELRVEAIIGQLRRWWWAQAPLDTCNGGFNVNKAKAFADALFGAAGKIAI
jgi:CRISPR type III-B/RAMP module RAMP protein Cmr1